jgi:hypothetical protein
VRVQIYTNDREQPIDLEVLKMHTKVRGINTNENGQQREPSVDQTVREVIKDPANGAAANLLFTTPDGREGAIYVNTDKVAAVVTSWLSAPGTGPGYMHSATLLSTGDCTRIRHRALKLSPLGSMQAGSP